jgi:hypothetical protein
VARLTLQLLPLSIRERMRMTPKVLTEARVGPSTSRRPLTFQVSANDDAGDGNGHCGVTNAQAKRHATEERDRPFGLRPRHVRERTATRRALADSGVKKATQALAAATTGASFIRMDVPVIGGSYPSWLKQFHLVALGQPTSPTSGCIQIRC